jgi:hypothetical protein
MFFIQWRRQPVGGPMHLDKRGPFYDFSEITFRFIRGIQNRPCVRRTESILEEPTIYILVFCTSGSLRDPWGSLHRGVYGGLMCATVFIKGHALAINDEATILINFTSPPKKMYKTTNWSHYPGRITLGANASFYTNLHAHPRGLVVRVSDYWLWGPGFDSRFYHGVFPWRGRFPWWQ